MGSKTRNAEFRLLPHLHRFVILPQESGDPRRKQSSVQAGGERRQFAVSAADLLHQLRLQPRTVKLR